MSKYRQRGYMDSDRESQRPKPHPSRNQSLRIARAALAKNDGIGEASKCTACGAKAPPNINVDSSCQSATLTFTAAVSAHISIGGAPRM